MYLQYETRVLSMHKNTYSRVFLWRRILLTVVKVDPVNGKIFRTSPFHQGMKT